MKNYKKIRDSHLKKSNRSPKEWSEARHPSGVKPDMRNGNSTGWNSTDQDSTGRYSTGRGSMTSEMTFLTSNSQWVSSQAHTSYGILVIPNPPTSYFSPESGIKMKDKWHNFSPQVALSIGGSNIPSWGFLLVRVSVMLVVRFSHVMVNM